MSERCEWNAILGVPALDPPSFSDCKNEAVVSLGKRGEWHLCESCAALPRFKRFTVRFSTERVWP
jgi:hypothetical protein